MLTWRERYQHWLNRAEMDREVKQQLLAWKDNEALLEDCFYRDLDFGTGGIRGEIGPGPNRINRYTIRKVVEGYARYLLDRHAAARNSGVVIAYDTRYKSGDFAWEAACLLGKHGFRVYLFDRACPTPLLSYAVRMKKAAGGIMFTASHNPPAYNGCKLYGADGGQLTPAIADRITQKIRKIEDEWSLSVLDEASLRESGRLTLICEDVLQSYLSCLQAVRLRPNEKAASDRLEAAPNASPPLSIVFTPLHGTALETMQRTWAACGYPQPTIVSEQADPDPAFSQASSLNPEEVDAFSLAMRYGRQVHADLLLATDPDADRLGVAVLDSEDHYQVLSGNQLGVLLLDHILSVKAEDGTLPTNGAVLKTIVSTELARAIADAYGVATIDTLTGFKYIGEKMSAYAESGVYQFLFGFEESNGYVIGDFVRDKDGIQAAIWTADMCARWKANGKTLHQRLLELYAVYGFYQEELVSLEQKGKTGVSRIAALLDHFRHNAYPDFAGEEVAKKEDYRQGTCQDFVQRRTYPLALPLSNVLKYTLADGSWFCLRHSGTEPKMKCYFGVKGSSLEESNRKLARLKQEVLSLTDRLLSESQSAAGEA
ncbi:phospho-sugar mutase [Brevibacillus composti]|uniref:Phosphoglucomutase n=1 Tax=Brevibacillus composti TaxID=2796470 RepID=A0A7T5EHA5_9BACL|nr:phospho-sugar mutase [Brevibacillus composti]QQE72621.1 phospho-sugar mutase [Brevibacillus composti]QUO39698.1 phospho-sugar mutase [Brevibacillus composti]